MLGRAGAAGLGHAVARKLVACRAGPLPAADAARSAAATDDVDCAAHRTASTRAPHGCESGIAPAIQPRCRRALQRGEQSAGVPQSARLCAGALPATPAAGCRSCPHCAAYRVFHKPDRTLRCHHCGLSERVPRACPTCGNSALQGIGRGTERIEESLQQLLPTARVLRIDRRLDTAARLPRPAPSTAVHRGDVDVLVGTQMIAKGHDFRNVTLVVVLNPDSQLASHDFRASERLFATLVQVVGRAGRSGGPSRALVQTRFPQHPLFAALARTTTRPLPMRCWPSASGRHAADEPSGAADGRGAHGWTMPSPSFGLRSNWRESRRCTHLRSGADGAGAACRHRTRTAAGGVGPTRAAACLPARLAR